MNRAATIRQAAHRVGLKRVTLAAVACVALLTLPVSLAGCSNAAEPTIVGNWADTQGNTATVLEDGQCTGMYYLNGSPLDIGGGMTCSYSNGTLVVTQPPNEITYQVELATDTMTLTSGGQAITFNRLGTD